MSRRSYSTRTTKRPEHAHIFAALGDTTRLALVARLSCGEPFSIVQLTAGSRLSRQAITKHLRVLEHAGVVRGVRRGRESLFHLHAAPIQEASAYLAKVSAQWGEALARLKVYVED